jgi:hypothetical protein
MFKNIDKKLSTIAIIYFVIGMVFAIFYALFYHWELFAFFSPGFYMVVLSWPFQIPGFLADYQIYGLAGKVL